MSKWRALWKVASHRARLAYSRRRSGHQAEKKLVNRHINITIYMHMDKQRAVQYKCPHALLQPSLQK